LELRSVLTRSIRGFFHERHFLEIDTPVRLPAPALEDYIDAEPAGPWYLRTSPELHMKRLLVAGYERIFQIGPCFRQGERGRLHLPEFTMLEWYRAWSDYRGMLSDTMDLLRHLDRTLNGGSGCEFGGGTVDVQSEWQELTVDEAFAEFADGVSAGEAIAEGTFESVLVDRIEPHLGHGRPTILKDYPVAMAALARPKEDDAGRAERWELYIGGLELANAYSELTDATEQRRRFEATAELRRREGRDVYPLDVPFLEALEHGMPPSGGIALGVDRLAMVFAGADRIDDVVAFAP